jgi:hypothetical protein
MDVVVSDTSVLIDLERGHLLEPVFRLPFSFAVPDLLYNRELAAYNGPQLLALGLRVETLTHDEVTTATVTLRAEPKLSTPDAFAYALAHHRAWPLLTGDGALRTLASNQSLDYHGVLWLLDQLHEKAIVRATVLHTGLKAISGHPRCRLPSAEISARLRRWSGDA